MAKSKNKRKHVPKNRIPDIQLRQISLVSGIANMGKVRELTQALINASDSPRPSFANALACADIAFPQLKKIALEAYESRTQRDEEEPAWYMDFAYTAQEYMKSRVDNKHVEELFLRRRYDDFHNEAMRPAIKLSNMLETITVVSWNQGKLIYLFDNDLYTELVGMDYEEMLNLPLSVFNSLPSWAFYIDTPQDEVFEGICVAVCRGAFSENKNELSMIMVGHRSGFGSTMVPVRLYDCLETLRDGAIEEVRDNLVKGDDSFSNKLLEIAIPLILYLCTVNADVPEIKQAEPTLLGRKPTPKDADAKPVQEVFVGERVGASIRADRVRLLRESRGASTSSNRTRVPHIRKAHIHSYWVGSRAGGRKGEKLIAKWVAPVLVNADLANEKGMPVTTHKVYG